MNKFQTEIVIEDKVISSKSPTYIIAEAGVNHNGDMVLAKRLVDVACEAGADAVKFQLFDPDELILPDVEKAPYQKTAKAHVSQYDMLKELQISKHQCLELKDYCFEKGITFLATPFDFKSLDELRELGIAALKISSTDTTNVGFLIEVAKSKVPIILSTGMCFGDEVALALDALSAYTRDVILLHCTSAYPFPESEANLNNIKQFTEQYGIITGYSDHSEGIGVSPYAVAAGAKVIEKHFTLDKNMTGPDHKASLEPQELIKFVQEIQRVDNILGSHRKNVSLCELENRKAMQKCLVAKRDIFKGQLICDDDIVAKRTGGKGVPAIYFTDIVGTRACSDFAKNELIRLS
ncbi:N-acetylneuraminate synthase family protein [Planctobacterium marinum]|uniref:N-acetylneuraminate synthase family protein n=1 Tax=Planctobacterium marinum TaxID=1631968 RepID=UPI0030C778EE